MGSVPVVFVDFHRQSVPLSDCSWALALVLSVRVSRASVRSCGRAGKTNQASWMSDLWVQSFTKGPPGRDWVRLHEQHASKSVPLGRDSLRKEEKREISCGPRNSKSVEGAGVAMLTPDSPLDLYLFPSSSLKRVELMHHRELSKGSGHSNKGGNHLEMGGHSHDEH